MPALKYSKIGKKTYVYIVENKTVIDSDTGKTKKVRVQLESLGVLNKDVSLKIRNIKYDDVEKLKDSLISFLSNRSIHLVLLELRKAMKYAKKRNYIVDIPIIEHLKEYPKEIIRLSKKQLKELINTATGSTKFYIYVMSFTGMRPNEFFKLT
jgi:hypothetical protein